jgi:hypothetical protein
VPSFGPLPDILGRTKDFSTRWVGSPLLNRLGLHPLRIAVTDACLRARRGGLDAGAAGAALVRDGVAVVHDALPAATFAAMRDEAHAAIEAAARSHPLPAGGGERGFGKKRPFPGGFDRFDGGTLNRYLDIDERLPATAAAVRDPGLAALCRFASGFRHRPGRFHVYQTVHGDQIDNPDPQRDPHRDTFHSAIKLWLFIDEATADHGPFMYSPGSHRMTAERYRWEYRRACAASRGGPDRDGSFRIGDRDLAALGLPPLRAYPVPANTLVIADVRGFHRRGDAAAGATRLALYANLRLWPFTPVPY